MDSRKYPRTTHRLPGWRFKVMRYIEQQTEHHRRMTFQDELREMLGRHGLDFDERYLWDELVRFALSGLSYEMNSLPRAALCGYRRSALPWADMLLPLSGR